MVASNFEIDDLVWAKMKNYPFWPAKIVDPPGNSKSTPSKKAQHYVFFFGSENFAWIPDEHIVHHSEEMLEANKKKKFANYKLAIDKIIDESSKVPMKNNTYFRGKDENELHTESPSISKSERKVSQSQRTKSKYESAKKRYFAKVQKTSQNQYLAKMQKKVRKKYFMDGNKGFKTEAASVECNGESLQGLSSTFSNKIIQSTKKKIGFLGLGKMGGRIVEKLIESEHNVTVWNRTWERCAEFAKLGAHCALTPSSVIAECDITFCCVSGPDAVNAIIFGPDGVLVGLDGTTGKGYVELTTVDQSISKEIAEAIGHKGGSYLESPITESKKPDNSESLVVICAGDYELFGNCESCFYAFTSDAYYVGGMVGSGLNMKFLTSMFVNTVYAALAESLALIKRLNLSQDALLEFLKHGPLNCVLLQDKGRAMAENDFFSGGSIKYLQKDLSLAVSLGDSCEQPMPVTAAASELYKYPIRFLYGRQIGTSSSITTEDQ